MIMSWCSPRSITNIYISPSNVQYTKKFIVVYSHSAPKLHKSHCQSFNSVTVFHYLQLLKLLCQPSAFHISQDHGVKKTKFQFAKIAILKSSGSCTGNTSCCTNEMTKQEICKKVGTSRTSYESGRKVFTALKYEFFGFNFV